jgi:hypothetical protein
MAIAFHEAGHAVACFEEGIRIRDVSIESNVESDGRVTHRSPLGVNLDLDSSHRSRLKVERRVRVCLAGPIAHRRFSKRSYRDFQGADDHKLASELLVKIVGSMEELEAYLNLLSIQADALVTLQWGQVKAVARALVDRRVLSGREVAEIIRSTM